MKWPDILRILLLCGFVACLLFGNVSARAKPSQREGIRPIADAGLSQYAATEPVKLDGSKSYDPDNSGILSYNWRQTGGPQLVMTDANSA